MATIKLGNTKAGSRLINYAEKRAEIGSGVNCPAEYARAQMKATRELWGKPDGIQAHHVIQSFKPDEVSAEQANEIGRQLAEEIAPGHECAVFTHTDKDHIHNHIVVNAVNFEDGSKYQAHGKKAIENIRDASDQLCLAHDLSVVKEPSAEVRYTLAEQSLLEKGQDSWKDEIREAINLSKEQTADFDSFKNHLEATYGIETKLRGKTLSFKHPDRQRFVRANKLGLNYERGALENEFERKAARGTELERDFGGNPRAKQVDDQLHQSSDERGHSKGFDDRQPVRANQEQQQRDHAADELIIAEAERTARGKQRQLAKGFDRWTEANTGKQRAGHQEAGRTGTEQSRSVEQHERGNKKEHEQNADRAQPNRKKSRERDTGLSL